MKGPRGKTLDRFKAIPEFSLTTQEGKPLSLDDLKGKIWVANFIFTRCPGPCPAISARMAELHSQIAQAKADDVRLVSFSVDPENDTPEVLATYAKAFNADPARWSFLTGEPAKVQEIVEKGFLQSVVPGGDEGPTHSVRFVVVDGEGIMRSYHDGTDPEVVQKLLMDIGALLRERKEAKPKARS